jgi:hypothetical protein
MLKAELIDKTGKVVTIVRQTENHEYCFSGIISIPTGWDAYDNDVCDEDFLAYCSIKWDGCSHFWYYGENYPYDEELYPYYHECGLNDYYKNFVAKLFAFEVAKYYMKDVADMNDNLYNTINRINILDFYTIRYSEINLDNDWFYRNCIEKLK